MARKPPSRPATPEAIIAAAAATPVPASIAKAAVVAPKAPVMAAAVAPAAVESVVDATVDAAAAAPAPVEAVDAAREQIDTVREMVRQSSEAALEQSRALYERMKQAAEEATGSLETAYGAANKGVAEINLKAIETLKANTDAAFEFARALGEVKSFSELLALQSEHARKGYETLAEQARTFAGLAQKVAADSVGPLNARLGALAGKQADIAA